MREMRNNYKILIRSLKGIDQSEYPGVGGRIILKRILRNNFVGCGLDSPG
jgi:hypothetical protein